MTGTFGFPLLPKVPVSTFESPSSGSAVSSGMHFPFPVDAVRRRFPALADGRIFLDNPGGTQVPESVIEAVAAYWTRSCANVGGAFPASRDTDSVVLEARRAVADLLGAPDPHCIVFGASMTALTFHLARSIVETLRPGDEIVTTQLDHDANVAPWRDAEAVGAVVRSAPLRRADATLDTEALVALLRPGKTRLVAVTAASNAVGSVPDLRPVIAAAHAAGAWVFVDGVQSVPHIATDVQALGADFLACSAYKFMGPHVGILYGKREHLEALRPHKVRPAKDTIPHCWETGTLNHEGLAAVAAAVEHIASLGEGTDRRTRILSAMARIGAHETALCARLLAGLATRPWIHVHGIIDPERLHERIATIALTVDGTTPRAVAEHLGAHRIHCWSGDYYAVNVMEALGLAPTGAVRLGIAHYNTAEEIDRTVAALDQLAPSGSG